MWAVAILIGLVAGTWSAITSASEDLLSSSAQSVALSSAQSAESPAVTPASENPVVRAVHSVSLSSARSAELAAETVGTDSQGSPSFEMQAATWISHTVWEFLKTAWWVLPLPILFSLWRQFKAYEVCRNCGSRELVPVVTPHGEEPPSL